MTVLQPPASIAVARLATKLRAYWALIKGLQTGLLLVTGIAGWVSTRAPLTWPMLLALSGSLFLAISGSTVLNMVNDADIDARMKRTKTRPLPTGRVAKGEAFALGVVLAGSGVGWALAIAPLYGGVVLAGLGFDVVVYTVWLKRRTPWSIVWGGISGGMPILAGRALGVATIDPIGLVLALAVLLWTPSHILTLSLKDADDYCLAGVPIFPNTCGAEMTRLIITLSTAGAVIVMLLAEWQIRLAGTLWPVALALGGLLLALTFASMWRPSEKSTTALYKLASLYMLSSMLLIVIGAKS